jgi:hypothetical protein
MWVSALAGAYAFLLFYDCFTIDFKARLICYLLSLVLKSIGYKSLPVQGLPFEKTEVHKIAFFFFPSTL